MMVMLWEIASDGTGQLMMGRDEARTLPIEECFADDGEVSNVIADIEASGHAFVGGGAAQEFVLVGITR